MMSAIEIHHQNQSNEIIAEGKIGMREIRTAISNAVELRAFHAALMDTPANPSRLPSMLAYPPKLPRSVPHFPAQDYPVFSPSYVDRPENWRGSTSSEPHICPSEDNHNCNTRNQLDDFGSASSSCNKCKPAIICSESDSSKKTNRRSFNVVVPFTASSQNPSPQVPRKPTNRMLSWIFPQSMKKSRTPNGSHEASPGLEDLGILSTETLKKQLLRANRERDEALREVEEMKSSFGELKHKLDYLETYCNDLNGALKKATGMDSHVPDKKLQIWRIGNGETGTPMPMSDEVLVEGFLQMISEARSSIKQFCKTLQETHDFTKFPSFFHLEGIVNKSFYENFENCVFQKNGSPKFLDPDQERRAQFSSFVTLRNLRWNEVARKGTKQYSEEFSNLCDLKMSCIMHSVKWKKPWPQNLLRPFFIAAKCVWLLHLLAFSFDPPMGILRVEEKSRFDPGFMEDIVEDRRCSEVVRLMVMPGFYLKGRVLKSKVLCMNKPSA